MVLGGGGVLMSEVPLYLEKWSKGEGRRCEECPTSTSSKAPPPEPRPPLSLRECVSV